MSHIEDMNAAIGDHWVGFWLEAHAIAVQNPGSAIGDWAWAAAEWMERYAKLAAPAQALCEALADHKGSLPAAVASHGADLAAALAQLPRGPHDH